MAKKQTEEERIKELAILKATNELLEQSKERTLLKGHKEEASLIERAVLENKERVKIFGATEKDLENIDYKEPSSEEIYKFEKYCKKRGIDTNSIYDKSLVTTVENVTTSVSSQSFEKETFEMNNDYILEAVEDYDNDIQYDVLPLPSNGESYSHKKNRLPVSFLTASDENLITSPNLYRDGKIIDVLLKRKIMDKNIDTNALCKGDRDAIILWLRATGYGPEFPITVHDPELDTEYETIIDLTQIKSKPFSLKGDQNGHFDYTTRNGTLIKFKFLNRYDEIKLSEMAREDNLNIKRFRLERIVSDLKQEMKNDNVLSSMDKSKVLGSINTLESWSNNIKTKNKDNHEKSITNSMLLTVMSINGNNDKDYIQRFVNTMPSYDAFHFRRYVLQNEPGMNFEIEVNRPENLGGGSFKTFLSIDSSIFINIA